MDNSTLEDLGLFGSDRIAGLGEEIRPQYNDVDAPVIAPAASPPSTPSSPSVYDGLGWNIPQFSPVGSDLFSSDQRNSHIRSESNLVNAVHMHVQDNARIPNYNYPVDRSNSSTGKNFTRNSYTSPALFSSKTEQDNSTAEIFLSSSNRKSLNQTYEVLGSLSTEDSNIQKEIDELAAVSVDPTPWSEIQDMIHIEEEREKEHQQVRRHCQQLQLSVTTYPHGIHHSPQPQTSGKIPSLNKNTAGQEVSRMAEALATAAAIARTNNGTENAVDNDANISAAKDSKLATMSGGESSTIFSIPRANQEKVQENNASTHQPRLPNVKFLKARSQPKLAQNYFAGDRKPASNQQLQRQRATANPPPHAAAHAVSRASVLAATNRKSQYGFGGNHFVPSVPAPPLLRSSNQPILQQRTVRKNKETSKITAVVSSAKAHIAVPNNPLTIPHGMHPSFHVDKHTPSAYERKKQKAKDARVKLNESIERLAIAVSLAGSQSKHRIDQLENQIASTEFRQKSIAVNQEGIKLAENAKKWDRPSFVGTAASVIQSLNAQCEALMTEMMAMHQMLNSTKTINGDSSNGKKAKSDDSTRYDAINDTEMVASSPDVSNTEIPKSIAEQSESTTAHQVHKRYQQPLDLMKQAQIPNKRPRLVIKETRNLPRNEEVVFGSIARMLDPLSLCRCASTTKLWRKMNAFKDENVWLNLAVKRFGFYNVRKWSENLKDGECEEISNKHLYEEMNASNVMPHFSQEGLSFIGNGRIQGKLSGWVFIVERSNGETLRSVKRDPSSGTSGGVGYQSRPIVELRIVVQNTGMATQPVVLKSQEFGVDISTRRKGGEFEEIYWDDRFKKVVRNIDGTIRTPSTKAFKKKCPADLCELELFESAVIEVHINARGCSTTSKFRQRSNFTKILATLDGTTIPLVIQFLKHEGMC